MKPRSYALIAAGVFGAEAAYVALHSLLGHRYAGFTHGHDVVVDTLLTSLWLTAAVALSMRRAPPAFAVIAFGVMVSFVNGVLYALAGGHALGLLFLAGAAVTGYCVKRSMPPLTEHVSSGRRSYVG